MIPLGVRAVAECEKNDETFSASENCTPIVQMHVQMTLQEHGTEGTMTGDLKPQESVVTLDQRDDSAPATSTVSVTCVSDMRIHEVRELDIAPAARQGRYPALCGQMITAASMAEPGRRRCPDCVALHERFIGMSQAAILAQRSRIKSFRGFDF